MFKLTMLTYAVVTISVTEEGFDFKHFYTGHAVIVKKICLFKIWNSCVSNEAENHKRFINTNFVPLKSYSK
jgi:hypothetical protein